MNIDPSLLQTAAQLAALHCRDLPDGKALASTEVGPLLALLPDWSQQGAELCREWSFPGFDPVQAAIRATMALAEEQDHHPQVCFGYRGVRVCFTTHSAAGLSLKDFVTAARLDVLLSASGGAGA